MACKLTTNRAFILKVKNFCKYYPLTSKDPEYMIRESINSLKRLVDRSKDISLLESLSKEAIAICTHSTPNELFQFQVAGENRFQVELQRPEIIYEEMSHKYLGLRGQEGLPIVIFGLGEAHSEDELFSAMNAIALLSVENNTNLYSLIVLLSYQERNNAFWNAEQTDQLKKLLSDNNNYSSIEHRVENRQHKLRVIDSENKISYDLHVGYENENTAWIGNVEAAAQFQNMLGDPQDVGPVLKGALDNSKNTLNPPSVQSAIEIKTFNEDDLTPCDFSLATGAEEIDNPEEIKAFTSISEKWAQFIEDAVNAMAKVKGIPQSGRLTLLPPQNTLRL